MNVKTLCLAILFDGDATGYEIRKLSTEGEYAYFVEASFGSIYPALQRLEADKLVVSRVEQQDGRPAKKIYQITEPGRRAFRESLFEVLDDDVFRSGFLLFARFAHELPASLVEQRLNERLDMHDQAIERLEKVKQDVERPADHWVVDYGLACMRVARQHMANHMQDLIALAQPDQGVKAAE